MESFSPKGYLIGNLEAKENEDYNEYFSVTSALKVTKDQILVIKKILQQIWCTQSKTDIQFPSLHIQRKKKQLEINRTEKSAHVDLILHHVTG